MSREYELDLAPFTPGCFVVWEAPNCSTSQSHLGVCSSTPEAQIKLHVLATGVFLASLTSMGACKNVWSKYFYLK